MALLLHARSIHVVKASNLYARTGCGPAACAVLALRQSRHNLDELERSMATTRLQALADGSPQGGNRLALEVASLLNWQMAQRVCVAGRASAEGRKHWLFN